MANISKIEAANLIKKTVLSLSIPDNASKTDIDNFYAVFMPLATIVEEAPSNLQEALAELSCKDAVEMLEQIGACIQQYAAVVIDLNETLLSVFNAANISKENKVNIAEFGKASIETAENTIHILRDLAKYITINANN